MNLYDLKDRVAIVTGAAQGIGLAVTNRILASGGKVAIWDRDKEMLGKTVKALDAADRVTALPSTSPISPPSKPRRRQQLRTSAKSISSSTTRPSSGRMRIPGNIRPKLFAMSSMSD